MELNTIQQKITKDDPLRAIIGTSTGSGKTITSLLLSEGTVLVISPKSNVADANFSRDAKKLNIDEPVHISKETFRKYHKELPKFDTVIFDEGEFILGVHPQLKSKKRILYISASQLHNAALWYIKFHNPKRVYIVTATAVELPMNAWAAARILGFVKNEMESFIRFRSQFYISRKKGYGEIWMANKSKKAAKELSEKLQKLGYFIKMEGREPDILDIKLPMHKKVSEKSVQIDMTYPEILVQNTRKFGAENGVYNDMIFDDELHTAKKFTEEIETNYDKKIVEIAKKHKNLIIFAMYTRQILHMQRLLRTSGFQNIHTLQGETKQEDREKALNAIKNDDVCILISQSSICAGWESIKCDAIIILSVTRWRHYEQMKGRNHRWINRFDKKTIYRFITIDGISEKVWGSIDRKEDFNLLTFI